jgi:hypothetical protein
LCERIIIVFEKPSIGSKPIIVLVILNDVINLYSLKFLFSKDEIGGLLGVRKCEKENSNGKCADFSEDKKSLLKKMSD